MHLLRELNFSFKMHCPCYEQPMNDFIERGGDEIEIIAYTITNIY